MAITWISGYIVDEDSFVWWGWLAGLNQQAFLMVFDLFLFQQCTFKPFHAKLLYFKNFTQL